MKLKQCADILVVKKLEMHIMKQVHWMKKWKKNGINLNGFETFWKLFSYFSQEATSEKCKHFWCKLEDKQGGKKKL